MKILMINKFFHRSGGPETYMFGLMEQLQAKGHEIAPFSMTHEKNEPSPYARYFVANVDYQHQLSVFSKLSEAGRILYSLEARRNLQQLVQDVRPAIAHCHNIYHQISPSIFPLLRKYHIPIVMTVHDYKLLCGNYKMLSHGRICERCYGGRHYNAVLQRCVKNTIMPSILATVEMYFHHLLNIYNLVDVFVTPSAFLGKKLVAYGFAREKVVHIPNFVDVESYTPTYSHRDYFAYVGRLSEEKGLKTLLQAMRQVKNGNLLIIGSGPQRAELEELVEKYGLTNITFAGFLTGEKLTNAVRNAMSVVLPSECYENNPMAILEAFAMGKPVIGASIGGIPELIDNGQDGLLFEAGSAEDLAQKMHFLLMNKARLEVMGKAGRAKAEQRFGPVKHYTSILALYENLVDGRYSQGKQC